jgi:NAD(P)-dependent dehydrogenase (short-subunit alcohol dehydrogenase family)
MGALRITVGPRQGRRPERLRETLIPTMTADESTGSIESELADTVAFVTGASRGIGREIALLLADYGADVTLAARSDGIYETEDLIGDPDRTLPIETDVTDEAAVEAAIATTAETFGGLDCLVNNAGIGGPTAPVEEVTVSEWQQVQDVNVLGTFLCTKHAVPHLRESDRGSMIAISSISAKEPDPLRTPYTASNAAQIAFTRAIAYELADDGVTANTICPSAVEGDRNRRKQKDLADREDKTVQEIRQEIEDHIPLGELIDPQDIGEMVAYLAGPHGRYITAQDINVDGGVVVY